MSDNPWAAVHHEDLDTDDPGSTHDPQHAGGDKGSGRQATKKSDQASKPIGLTLDLPQDMIDAVWGAADQLKRVALAIEENTAETRKLIDLIAGARETKPDDTESPR